MYRKDLIGMLQDRPVTLHELARLLGKDAMEIDRIVELKRRMAQKRG